MLLTIDVVSARSCTSILALSSRFGGRFRWHFLQFTSQTSCKHFNLCNMVQDYLQNDLEFSIDPFRYLSTQ
jgi:hypothetical protein